MVGPIEPRPSPSAARRPHRRRRRCRRAEGCRGTRPQARRYPGRSFQDHAVWVLPLTRPQLKQPTPSRRKTGRWVGNVLPEGPGHELRAQQRPPVPPQLADPALEVGHGAVVMEAHDVRQPGQLPTHQGVWEPDRRGERLGGRDLARPGERRAEQRQGGDRPQVERGASPASRTAFSSSGPAHGGQEEVAHLVVQVPREDPVVRPVRSDHVLHVGPQPGFAVGVDGGLHAPGRLHHREL